ncbi:MAG: type II toxin-antitoxin system RelE/ParE family toxin [Bacteroidetes bacterium]|nr:type II toxin-antitoxin system RelE/ParE family toxin [Bacteroidota bacterium]
MALIIFWSKQADQKFDSILDYLQNEFGEKVATNFLISVHNFLNLLAKFPELGTEENSELCIRGFVIAKQVTLFYQIKSDTIILLNFYDNRQDPKRKKY